MLVMQESGYRVEANVNFSYSAGNFLSDLWLLFHFLDDNPIFPRFRLQSARFHFSLLGEMELYWFLHLYGLLDYENEVSSRTLWEWITQ